MAAGVQPHAIKWVPPHQGVSRSDAPPNGAEQGSEVTEVPSCREDKHTHTLLKHSFNNRAGASSDFCPPGIH